jgi:hypothetical protein
MGAAATGPGAVNTDLGSCREGAACRGTKLSWFYGGHAERAKGRAVSSRLDQQQANQRSRKEEFS